VQFKGKILFCFGILASQLLACFNTKADSTNSFNTAEEALVKIQSVRARISEGLHANPRSLSAQDHDLLMEKIAIQANELSKLTELFLEQFPTNASLTEITKQNIYGDVLSRMLDKERAAWLGNLAEYIPSCLFESSIKEVLHSSDQQASQLQSAAESGFVDAAIDAMQFGPQSFNGLYSFLRRARTDAGKKLADSILKNPVADDSLKQCAQAILNRKYSIGQTLPIKFTAVNGRQVDLSAMHGKVVLVDFWGTSCAPCMSELPELKALEQKYQDQGFEIIGISADSGKEKLLRVLQEKGITWPNYYDENGSTNQFAMACGVLGIPDYWLVDRKGIVQEMDARDKLEEKIKFLTGQAP
jgi:thiol-disulfide isomerase/thioredoxin